MKHPHRTLTLVELIVATAIMTLALAGSLSLYYQTSTYSRSSGYRAEARSLAQTQLATLRRILRAAPLVAGGNDNRAVQFGATLTAVGTFDGTNTWQGTQTATLDRGRTTVTLVTRAFVSEAAGEAGLGLTAGSLDLDADGNFGGNAAIADADLWALPVSVTVTWTPPEGLGAAESLTVTGILY